MNQPTLHSPILLSYAAALRNFQPRQPGETFTYADADCRDPDLLMCLAASNPEGRFFGLVEDQSTVQEAQATAKLRAVNNVSFIPHTLTQTSHAEGLPPLHYLCYDETCDVHNEAKKSAVFDLAEKLLLPNGLLNITYAPYDDADGALRFLVREFAPEMNAYQAKGFLVELKKMGKTYFSLNPALAAKLDDAIATGQPDAFFALWDMGKSLSHTFNTIVALRPRGFSYAGDVDIPSNYVELSVPPEGQQIVVGCRDNHLYEMIKDFALNRMVRSDIWCRQPVRQTSNMPDLFGGFSYGITMPRSQVPSEVAVHGKVIDLSSSIYTTLIELMTLMPITIGDFLAHPEGKYFTALDTIGALQILIACGIASPMRGGQHVGSLKDLNTPRLAGLFNQSLGKTELSGNIFCLASPVVGDAIHMSPREALVIQAIDRGGLVNSVAALLPELQRLSKNPKEAMRILDTSEPTQETAENMIHNVLERSMVQWYAYGILETAA